MLPMRRLLYHRGIDDHVGTYVTDYVFSTICFLLCVQLFIRIRKERGKMAQDQQMASSCWHWSNWLPWNWPKEKNSSITLTTYAVLLLGFSNFVMSLFGGLTHQFLQTVEPYNGHVTELWEWLIVWRTGASFSAFLCLSLFILTEQLIVQEGVVRISRPRRIVYYVVIIIATIFLFCYNYIPLVGKHNDPFSIGKTFIISFAVMLVYGITTTIVLIRHMCCRRSFSSETGSQYSPACSVESAHSETTPHRKDLFSCYKNVVGSCRAVNDMSRRWELTLTMAAPWIFVIAGAINYFMKKKCADSDSASVELGCPLPDTFNHNALMHVIQIVSVVIFFIAENIALTRRSDVTASNIKRANTSSTIYNDVINSCIITYPKTRGISSENVSNNNISNKRDDVICRISLTDSQESDKELIITLETESGDEIRPEPKFPTCLNIGDNRQSVYDNL